MRISKTFTSAVGDAVRAGGDGGKSRFADSALGAASVRLIGPHGTLLTHAARTVAPCWTGQTFLTDLTRPIVTRHIVTSTHSSRT